MNKVTIAALASGMLALGSVFPANATLHGWCGAGPTSTCIDNGTNSPTSHKPPDPFGFTSSPPGAIGVLSIAVLVPDNENAGIGSFAITGAASAVATLFSATPWTSGQLDAYLGISAGPTNPIGAYLPSTQALDPGARGFFVYLADMGTQTLAGPGGPPNQLFNVTALPLAAYLVAFMDEMSAEGIEALANSGAIFITTRLVDLPEPATLLILGSGVLGIGLLRRRRTFRLRLSG